MSVDEQERLISILSFWHKLEFFLPFDLDQRIDETESYKVCYLRRQDLDCGRPNLWQGDVKQDDEVTGFNLYLCVFDKSEIIKVCNEVLGSSQEATDDEDFERIELEGNSCFAQLTINTSGELILETPPRSSPVSSVSTVPWALGQIQKAGLATLTFEGFEIAKQNVAELLSNFKANRKLPSGSKSENHFNPLTHSDILELQALFQDWAGFSSSETELIGILEAKTQKKRKQTAPETSDNSSECDSNREQFKPDIAILNSFFIHDIESAINAIRAGYINRPLKNYLAALADKDQVDLESSSGLRAILETLRPAHASLGRWFTNADRPMTLMQQFAINSVLQARDDAPALFSSMDRREPGRQHSFRTSLQTLLCVGRGF